MGRRAMGRRESTASERRAGLSYISAGEDRHLAEPGFGTVGVALAILAAALVMVGMLQLFYTSWERMDVRNTADLAAVSGAIVLRESGSEALGCERAREIAAGMSIRCSAEGELFTVVVEKQPRFSWISSTHSATAVAGPSDARP